MSDLRRCSDITEELFKSKNYKEVSNDPLLPLPFKDYVYFLPYDELHFLSNEQDCGNDNAQALIYGFNYEPPISLVYYTQATRLEIWDCVIQLELERNARILGFSCNPNGLTSHGWISIRLHIPDNWELIANA